MRDISAGGPAAYTRAIRGSIKKITPAKVMTLREPCRSAQPSMSDLTVPGTAAAVESLPYVGEHEGPCDRMLLTFRVFLRMLREPVQPRASGRHIFESIHHESQRGGCRWERSTSRSRSRCLRSDLPRLSDVAGRKDKDPDHAAATGALFSDDAVHPRG